MKTFLSLLKQHSDEIEKQLNEFAWSLEDTVIPNQIREIKSANGRIEATITLAEEYLDREDTNDKDND